MPDSVARIVIKPSRSGKNILGFTLIEMMLAVAVIGIITGISAPVYQSFQNRNNIDIAAASTAQSLRRAEALATAVDGDDSWGVKIQPGSIILFKGASYEGRDTAFDEIFDVPASIVPSGLAQVVFARFSGIPQETGTITLTNNNADIRTIAINAKGTITY